MLGMPRTPGLLAGGVFVLLVILALAAQFAAPPSRFVDIGAPGDAYVATSFYAAESAADGTTFRWSGPFSALQMPALAVDHMVLSLRFRGALSNSPLYLRPADRQMPMVALPTSDQWRVYHLLINQPATPLFSSAPVLALAGELVRPLPDDSRSLGVALDWLRITPLNGLSGAWNSALAQAALFGWALALIAGLIRLAYAVAHPGVAIGRAVFIGWGPPALLGALLIAWARHDLYALQWMLPLQPGPLFLASLALAAGWGIAGWGTLLHVSARRLGVVAVSGGALLAHLLLLLPVAPLWRGLAALYLLWLPGALLARLAFRRETDRITQVLLGLCGAVAGQILLMLLFAVVPGPITELNLLVACNLISLAAGGLLMLTPAPAATVQRPVHWDWLLALLVLLAILLRLPFLGSAELHDDEASVLIAATQLVAGQYEPLMTQLKGPAQIVLPAGILALTGQLPESTARLPFALAGIGVVLGGFVLARELFGPARAGTLLATALLALDGFLIGFSRIVQYQSVVLLLCIGAIWCLLRFASGAPATLRLLTAAAVLYAAALLGHHDAIFAAPALAWLLWAGARRRNWHGRNWLTGLALPLAVGGGILAGFYVPFALHPHFAKTIAHLGERTGQHAGASLYNNLADTAALALFYQSPAQQWFVALVLLVGALLALLHYVRPRALAWVAALWLAGAGGLLFWNPAALGPLPVLLVLAVPMVVLLLAPAMPASERAIWLWACGAWAAMIFLIAQPRTHIYVAAVPTALLIGAAVAQRTRWIPATIPTQAHDRAANGHNPVSGFLLPFTLAAAIAVGVFQANLFLRPAPEYVRDYPATLLYGEATKPINPNARFGFPVRDGWKAVAELYRAGVLDGAFAGNQSSEVLAWYTGGMRRCGAEPRYALVALSEANPAIPPDAVLFGMVQVAGQNRIAIYRWGGAAAAPRIFHLESFSGDFDARPIPTIPPPEVACRS